MDRNLLCEVCDKPITLGWTVSPIQNQEGVPAGSYKPDSEGGWLNIGGSHLLCDGCVGIEHPLAAEVTVDAR